MRSVLIIGSGPIVIGQAAEFDYSGTQACLACREAGVRTVLVNSNPATIQTDPHVADRVYIEPLTVDSIEQIIQRERPDGVIASVGGQTALNLAVALDEAGVLERHGVRLLGTGLEAIRRGEDRALFAATLRQARQPILPSHAVLSVEMGLSLARSIGYPIMCRSAFALGGAGSGFASNPEELERQVGVGLLLSGSGQVLIEKSVRGWAEIEYEVVRDAAGNALVVCNMENIDPMGVHTGESMVVAPSQTLTDEEYHRLRAAAIRVVDALGVEGACNVQFALDRQSGSHYVIEVNPRLSRSSALASKATGYPIAKVATRIALGQTLPEIRNDITGTSAFFEPALDYVVVKIPRWPFDKLSEAAPVIGTSMKSTGEVMAIGRSFEEAMGKAVRSLDQKGRGDQRVLKRALAEPNAYRLGAVLRTLGDGWSIHEVSRLTGMHPWFLERLAALGESGRAGLLARSNCEEGAHGPQRHVPQYHRPQRHTGLKALPYQPHPAADGDVVVYKMVDTCAAEFEARTPYFYGTTAPGAENEATPLPGPKAIILGSGPIRIGQGIEFDYATVHACHALSEAGVRSIIINNNPETVSTDYSTSDRLYFEPLDIESVMAVVENEGEGLLGVVPQFGGQTAINLVQPLRERGVPILGTPPEMIDAAEDRGRASAVLERAGIPAPEWRSVERWEDLPAAVEEIGLPALLRPSYVLSGDGMTVVRSPADVERYRRSHGREALTKPLLVDRFLEGALELDVDAVSDGSDTVMVIMEQLEECGVHSGDSAEVYPVQTIPVDVLRAVEDYTRRLARAFKVVGLMNVQYAVHRGAVHVLEVNPRASRSVPFASKASGIPLADLAVRAILGRRLRDLAVPAPRGDRVCVKQVVFPFRSFPGLLPVLGPRMQSTGESMGIGSTYSEAYWKAWLGRGYRELPLGKPVYLSPGPEKGTPASLMEHLRKAGCEVIVDGERQDSHRPVDVSGLGLVIVLGQSADELALLRRAVDAGVPFISTPGGLRGLLLALSEGAPSLAASTAA